MPSKVARPRAARLSLSRAARLLRAQSILDVDHRLRLDVARDARTGIPEVVIAEGKSPRDVRDAVRALVASRGRAIVTRCPSGLNLAGLGGRAERHPRCGVVVVRRGARPLATGGRVAILTGGASDRRVAQEAAVVAAELGCAVRLEPDVGVASLARVLGALGRLLPWKPHAWIVCAGREGALAPVVSGLVPGPVIGVPVSTGYGYRGRGEAALAAMLQSCSPLVVVNVDAGFVAGAVASQIARRLGLAEKA